MKNLKWILLLMLLTNKNALALDGNDLMQNCNNAVEVMNNNYMTNVQLGVCLGYVDAVADIFAFKGFCPPVNSTYEQYVRIVTKYLNNNPEYLDMPAPEIILGALNKAFPCQKAHAINPKG